jgi:hypothetical protein
VDGGPYPGRGVGDRVVSVPGGCGREHRQHSEDERDVGRDPLPEQVEDDDQRQRPNRDVGQDAVERVPEPYPVEQVVQRQDPPEDRGGNPWTRSPSGLAQRSWASMARVRM